MTTITVTTEHIANGVREDAENCAIALALHEAWPDAWYIAVSGEGVTICPGEYAEEIEIDPPAEVAAFIEAFDGCLDVEPFTFELDYPAVTR